MAGFSFAKPQVSSPEPAKSNLLVVGHGGCGANALRAVLGKYDPDEHRYLSLLTIESNRQVLESCSKVEGEAAKKWIENPDRFRRIQLGEKGLGAGGNMEAAEQMARAKIDEVREYLTQFDNAVLIGGGGGGTCGAMPVVAQALSELEIPTYAILTMPRVVEGGRKARKAITVRDRMLTLCPTTIIKNECIPNKSLTYSGIWREINEGSLFWILWLLKALLQDQGDVIDLDGSDWKTATSVGRYTLPGFYDASNGLDDLERGLLGNPYLDARIIENALAVDFWFEGNWPVEEHDRVVGFIRDRMEHNDREDEIELKWGIREKGVPEGTKTVGFVAFAEKGPDDDRDHGEIARAKVVVPIQVQAALQPEVPDESDAPISGGEDGSTSAVAGSIDDRPQKTPFVGLVRGKKVQAEASPELVARYNALFASKPTLELVQAAKVVQRDLEHETSHVFDVPTGLS